MLGKYGSVSGKQVLLKVANRLSPAFCLSLCLSHRTHTHTPAWCHVKGQLHMQACQPSSCHAYTDEYDDLNGMHKQSSAWQWTLLYCLLQTATVRPGDIPMQRRRLADPAVPPPSDPQSPPCLVLGPDGHTLALATEMHSQSRLQGRMSISDDSSQSTMYTAFLNADEIAGARGSLPMDMIARSMGRTLSRPHSLTRRK